MTIFVIKNGRIKWFTLIENAQGYTETSCNNSLNLFHDKKLNWLQVNEDVRLTTDILIFCTGEQKKN